MIVVEGVDNSGKSTLVDYIVGITHWPVQRSEGPPKYPGEQNERVRRYMGLPRNIIFDRHPCVSQVIYGGMRSHHDVIDPNLIEEFYSLRPLFIYCDPLERGMAAHVFNPETDTPQHLAEVERNYSHLLGHYRRWAWTHANIVYRIGDPIDRVLYQIAGVVCTTGRWKINGLDQSKSTDGYRTEPPYAGAVVSDQ